MEILFVRQLYGVGKSAVGQIMKRYQLTGSLRNRKQLGRPCKTTHRQDNKLVILSKENLCLTAVDLNAQMRSFYGMNCSISTTKRRLHYAKLFGKRSAKKPLISCKNRNS